MNYGVLQIFNIKKYKNQCQTGFLSSSNCWHLSCKEEAEYGHPPPPPNTSNLNALNYEISFLSFDIPFTHISKFNIRKGTKTQ
jgi:hypothetical protein